jgi:hypothetical protein
MWNVLEASYGLENINRLEDELKEKNRKLESLKADIEAMERISKE